MDVKDQEQTPNGAGAALNDAMQVDGSTSAPVTPVQGVAVSTPTSRGASSFPSTGADPNRAARTEALGTGLELTAALAAPTTPAVQKLPPKEPLTLEGAPTAMPMKEWLKQVFSDLPHETYSSETFNDEGQKEGIDSTDDLVNIAMDTESKEEFKAVLKETLKIKKLGHQLRVMKKMEKLCAQLLPWQG